MSRCARVAKNTICAATLVASVLHARALVAKVPPSMSAGLPGEEARTLVAIKIAGAPAAVAAVLEVLAERVDAGRATAAEDISFEVISRVDRASVVTPGRPNERQLARVWIDLEGSAGGEGAPESATVYVVDGPWERILVRQVARHANPEVTWEEIGHIVESALGALRAGERIGVGRALAQEELLPVTSAGPPPPPEPDSPPPPAPPPSAAPGPSWGLRAGAFYAASAYGYGAGPEVASGPGALVEVHASSGAFGFGATVMGEYRFPSTVDRGSAVIRLEGGALHVLATASYSPAPRHHIQVAAGPGFELVRAGGTTPGRSDIRFTERTLDALPTVRLLARYTYRAGAVRVFGGAGLDTSFRTLRYMLARADGSSVVFFEPWAARPFFLIGVETN